MTQTPATAAPAGYRPRAVSRTALRELLEATLEWTGGGVADRRLLVGGTGYRLTHLADGAAGAAALLCESPPGTAIPEYLDRRRIRRRIGGASGRHLMIFTDTAHSALVWSWITKMDDGTLAYRELSFRPGQAWGPLRPVLESIAAGTPDLPPPGSVGSGRPRRPTSEAEITFAAPPPPRPSSRALLAALTQAIRAPLRNGSRPAAAQLIQDLIEGAEDPATIREQWSALLGVRVLDPCCDGGGWLETALDVLVPAYEAVLERMRSAVDDLARRQPAPRAERLGDLRRLVRRSGSLRAPAARRTFSTELALLHNLFGAADEPAQVDACRSRLASRLGGTSGPGLLAMSVRVAPRAGGARQRSRTLSELPDLPGVSSDERVQIVTRGLGIMLRMHVDAEVDLEEMGLAMAAAERRLDPLPGPLLRTGHLIERSG